MDVLQIVHCIYHLVRKIKQFCIDNHQRTNDTSILPFYHSWMHNNIYTDKGRSCHMVITLCSTCLTVCGPRVGPQSRATHHPPEPHTGPTRDPIINLSCYSQDPTTLTTTFSSLNTFVLSHFSLQVLTQH